MYTGMLDQNWIINFYRSIDYPIGTPSKLYEDDQAKIRSFLEEMITPQARPLGVLITYLCEIHIRKTFYMVDKSSNIQLSDINSKLHGRKKSQISY